MLVSYLSDKEVYIVIVSFKEKKIALMTMYYKKKQIETTSKMPWKVQNDK